MIIGLCGFIGSGKNTVADYLVEKYKFKQVSWAESVKNSVSEIFGWDRDLLDGNTTESRKWRETVDSWWANRLNIPHLSPRWVLQYFATQICRDNFHNDIWVASLENKIRNINDRIVISDCRFNNEIAAVKKLNGKILWVRRQELPIWYEDYRTNSLKISEWNIHPSETEWIHTEFHSVIWNTGTIALLLDNIDNIMSSLL